MANLRRKQKLFCENYTDIGDHKTFANGAQSAIKAGYSERHASVTACKLLKKPQVQEYLANVDQRRKRQANITKEQYVSMLLDTKAKCKSESVKARYDELIGKTHGFLKEQTQQAIAVFQKEDISKDIREFKEIVDTTPSPTTS